MDRQAPVMPAPAGEQRKAAIAATSSTVFGRFSADPPTMLATYSSNVMPTAAADDGPLRSHPSVRTTPGHRALQVMPSVPTSAATALVSPLIACLLVT